MAGRGGGGGYKESALITASIIVEKPSLFRTHLKLLRGCERSILIVGLCSPRLFISSLVLSFIFSVSICWSIWSERLHFRASILDLRSNATVQYYQQMQRMKQQTMGLLKAHGVVGQGLRQSPFLSRCVHNGHIYTSVCIYHEWAEDVDGYTTTKFDSCPCSMRCHPVQSG